MKRLNIIILGVISLIPISCSFSNGNGDLLPKSSEIKQIQYTIYDFDYSNLKRKKRIGTLPKKQWSNFLNLFGDYVEIKADAENVALADFKIIKNNGNTVNVCIWKTIYYPKDVSSKGFIVIDGKSYSVSTAIRLKNYIEDLKMPCEKK